MTNEVDSKVCNERGWSESFHAAFASLHDHWRGWSNSCNKAQVPAPCRGSPIYPLSSRLLAVALCFAFELFPAHRTVTATAPVLRQSGTDSNIIINDVTTKLTAEPEQQAPFLARCSLLTGCPESEGILCRTYCWSCHRKRDEAHWLFSHCRNINTTWRVTLCTAPGDVFLWSLTFETLSSFYSSIDRMLSVV